MPQPWKPLPIGKATLRCPGGDVTLVSVGVGVHRGLKAAEVLRKDGISAQVIDLRTISPPDRQLLCEAVSKTGCLIVINEDHEGFGLSGEIAAVLLAKGLSFKYARVCTR